MKCTSIIVLLLVFSLQANAQEDRFYIRSISETLEIPVNTQDSIVTYTGNDQRLKTLFTKYWVKVFRKGFKYAEGAKLKRTYFAIAENANFQNELLTIAPDVFEFSETISEETLRIYEPNDYGTTSTSGKNLGAQAVLDYYDFLGIPEAWYYTTGTRRVTIGISDGYIDPDDPEFKGKLTVFKKSSFSKGHGYSTAATAAAQGDNAYGIAGVCYDCSLATTTYGNTKNLDNLLELARAGVKVINCSWGSRIYSETAQEAINEMYDLGTVVVSVSHNDAYSKTKGKSLRYPGAYNHVISVGSIQHRYEDPLQSLDIEANNGKYYYSNLKYHLAQNGGFKNNDPEDEFVPYLSSTNNLDESVDIVAPGTDIFKYYEFSNTGEVTYNPWAATSPAAPLVSGTIGLMLSLNERLSVDEIETILKLTATTIDFVKANNGLRDKYGAGSLHTGRAVKFTHDMNATEDYAIVENQDFSRWEFNLVDPNKIKIRNQQFWEGARVDFTARQEIIIGPKTVLLPNKDGSILLRIDSEEKYSPKTN